MCDATSLETTQVPTLDTPYTPTSVDAPMYPEKNVPLYSELDSQFAQARTLVEDIVLKNYLSRLTSYEIVPIDEDLKDIGNIQLFRITEMVYQKDEYSTYKFASVFNSVQNLNCGVFIIADSDGKTTDFYMGVRSFDKERTTASLNATLRNALSGQFPGVKTIGLLDTRPKNGVIPDGHYSHLSAVELLSKFPSQNVVSVSCVATNKDENYNSNESFIQGLEKVALAMHGQRYTAVVLAKSTPSEQLTEMRHAYENIYTGLSPFATTQVSYGSNDAMSISDALSFGKTQGSSYSISTSDTNGTSTTTNKSVSQDNTLSRVMGAVGAMSGAAAGIFGAVAVVANGGAALPVSVPMIAAGAAAASAGMVAAFTKKSTTKSDSETKNDSHAVSFSQNETKTTSENYTYTKGTTSGTTNNLQLTIQNKRFINTLERIDLQLKRIDECESLGMWECAAYFLSDSQATAEMAAGTYKALMRGEKSGVETSSINFWGRREAKKLPLLHDYLTNLVHPVFGYPSASETISVTASSLVSGNELAIQMGLPRKSVPGFPVIEHAEFGKEVVVSRQEKDGNNFELGKIFSMGSKHTTSVRLDQNSLAKHMFITGSTGSGKSNAIYTLLDKLCPKNGQENDTKFLVIEPTKGEYKDVFGGRCDVAVYGTNPGKCPHLLQINPFIFPDDIHVLEHIDRLVEIFNACWPMYAAMPAILRESIERAYEGCGWSLKFSKNPGEWPTFETLLKIILEVVDDSAYSADTSNDYKGALVTRVRSLTRGIHGLIFSSDTGAEALFKQNAIVDISRVGSSETKALIMGILVLKLQEFRMSEVTTPNSGLRHITVLEEAHNLLRRTSSEQSQESSNLQGKSVEMLANAIAEMRTYGEGFIIADQSPGLMDMSVIRNTNTKIIMRLPDEGDRVLVGKAAGLNDSQIVELSRLEVGVAAISQSDWLEPVLCKVDRFNYSVSLRERYGSEPFTWKDTEGEAIRTFLSEMLKPKDVGRIPLSLDVVDRVRVWLGTTALSNTALSYVETALANRGLSTKQQLFIVVQLFQSHVRTNCSLEAASRAVTTALVSQYGVSVDDEIIRYINHLFEKHYPVSMVDRADSLIDRLENGVK